MGEEGNVCALSPHHFTPKVQDTLWESIDGPVPNIAAELFDAPVDHVHLWTRGFCSKKGLETAMGKEVRRRGSAF